MAKKHIEAGKGVIDCGATESLGGVDALEALMLLLIKRGLMPPEVDVKDRPFFSFGDGERKQVLSRVRFLLKALMKDGSLDIYALEAQGVPILISVKALKALGAIIDFTSGKAHFSRLHPTLVVQLEEAEGGHLLFDLANDLLKHAVGHIGNFNGMSGLKRLRRQ